MKFSKVQWSKLSAEFATGLAHGLLLRAGGQQTFTPDEIARVTQLYGDIRIAWDEEEQKLILTLTTHERLEEIQNESATLNRH